MSERPCMNCGHRSLEPFIDLGDQPNGNVFPSAEEISTEETYPFVMCVCTNCWQVQLETFPPVHQMFSHHPYLTGLNQPVVEHFESLARKVIDKFNLEANSLVFDIGANDGTLLSKFRDLGMRVMGMDPCHNTNPIASDAGIDIIRDFWNLQSARELRECGIQPDLITATAVFYHVDDLHSFIQGLDEIMRPETVFCAQCVYIKDLLENLQFDHFYHEHTTIHGIGPLKQLFSRYGFRLLDVELTPIHGGSFILYVGRDSSHHPTSGNIQKVIAAERDAGLLQLETYHSFTQQVDKNKKEMVRLLQEIAASGKTVYGLGAPLKSSTLLNYFGIGPEWVQRIVDVNPQKVGRFSPGTHIPIVHEDELEQLPDFFLVLTWNFLDFFMDKYQDYLENGGKFIVPHPKVKIISK